jgi:hypothetical protein
MYALGVRRFEQGSCRMTAVVAGCSGTGGKRPDARPLPGPRGTSHSYWAEENKTRAYRNAKLPANKLSCVMHSWGVTR